MAGINQKLEHKLLQKLSPQQIQLIKLLEVPIIELEQRIKKEIEENPALEEGKDLDDEMPVRENENSDFDKDEDKEFAEKNYHSHASKSGELMKACNVKKAIPVHFSRKYLSPLLQKSPKKMSKMGSCELIKEQKLLY